MTAGGWFYVAFLAGSGLYLIWWGLGERRAKKRRDEMRRHLERVLR